MRATALLKAMARTTPQALGRLRPRAIAVNPYAPSAALEVSKPASAPTKTMAVVAVAADGNVERAAKRDATAGDAAPIAVMVPSLCGVASVLASPFPLEMAARRPRPRRREVEVEEEEEGLVAVGGVLARRVLAGSCLAVWPGRSRMQTKHAVRSARFEGHPQPCGGLAHGQSPARMTPRRFVPA